MLRGGDRIYFLYLDEAGISKNSNHFILGGTIIHSNDWKDINEKITNLKKECFQDVYVDLKGLRRRRKQYISKNVPNPFFKMEDIEVKDFSDKIFDILSERKVTLMASIINKNELNKIYGVNAWDPYILSFEFIIERFDKFLIKNNEYGMVQIEFGNKELSKNLRRAHDNFITHGTGFQQIEKIIESCNFVFGPKNNFTQLADIFINSIFRLFEYRNPDCYERYKPYIDCSLTGQRLGYGIKYFPDIGIKVIEI